MTKYKYYFKKPKGEITKDILLWVATGVVVVIAATSPYFIVNIFKAFRKGNKYERKEIYNAFYRLRKEGCLVMKKHHKQLYISLTEKGRKRAGWYQIDLLKIKKSKKWNRKWYVIIFDISHHFRIKREALRGLLKRLGFFQLQKSVWIHPYNCRDEIDLLKDFFGFSSEELRLLIVDNIEDDRAIRTHFNLL